MHGLHCSDRMAAFANQGDLYSDFQTYVACGVGFPKRSHVDLASSRNRLGKAHGRRGARVRGHCQSGPPF